MATYTKRSTSGMVLVAVLCLLLNNNAVAAGANSRLLKQVASTTTTPAETSAAGTSRAAAVNFAPMPESPATPALEVTGPAPTAENVGPLVPGPEGEQVSASQALFSAIRARNVDEVQRFLDSGANTDVYSPEGTTPLIEAIALGATDIVNALLTKGVDTNLPSRPDGNTPLFYAVTLGNTELATRLLDAGADINLANAAGDTPLMSAEKQTPVNYDVVQLLLMRIPSATTSAVDYSKTDASGQTAQQIAQASGDQRLIGLFQNLPPAGETMPTIPAVATTAGGAGAGAASTLPLVVTAPVSEIVGTVPTAESGAFPIVGAGVPVGETIAIAQPGMLP